jgi:hypothetical protein
MSATGIAIGDLLQRYSRAPENAEALIVFLSSLLAEISAEKCDSQGFVL